MADNKKKIICRLCRQVFEVENKPSFKWMDDYQECFTPQYCSQKVPDPRVKQ